MYSNSKLLLIILATVFLIQCKHLDSTFNVYVTTAEELNDAIKNAEPGSVVTMANGIWKDIEISFYGTGTQEDPIMLKAETSGEVVIQGKSNLKLGGEHLIVDGLFFKNGSSPSRSVIQFFLNTDTIANHCQVTNCVIKNFNKSQKDKQDLWVLFKGKHNQLDHCYLAGKSNRGPTIRVDIAGNESINNYHRIQSNHFGPRPPKGGPSAETIQIGNSSTSMSPSYTMISDNLFDRCNGEVEVISSKTNFNEFRNNVFYKCEGSLVTRHGNYCIVDGNYFIGDQKSSNMGGVRLIGTGHWVTNNYFFNLKGDNFRAPLAIMNGIRKSALNRYIQVTDVVVAHNTYVNCNSPWQFGVGSNINQKDVLPASELRSETPIRTLVANNLIFNKKGDPMPIFRHDSIEGIEFKSNVINNQGVSFRGIKGLEEKDFSITQKAEYIWLPKLDLDDIEVHQGFEFEKIEKDIFGNSRKEQNSIGASCGAVGDVPDILNLDKYGPDWFDPADSAKNPKTHSVDTAEDLISTLHTAQNGDVILLASGSYEIKKPLEINKEIVIQAKNEKLQTGITYVGQDSTPAFEMLPGGQLTLLYIQLQGSGDNYAFASLRENMSQHYDLRVLNSSISNFGSVLKAYKNSFAQYIEFNNTTIKTCINGLELSSEDRDRGEYNVENLSVLNCQFEDVHKNVIDYYRGGYDESTVGGNLVVHGSTFRNCGSREKTGILIKTHGIVNVDISTNSFVNNQVALVARLWGAKNNSANDNTLNNSGKIITEENLAMKLMY